MVKKAKVTESAKRSLKRQLDHRMGVRQAKVIERRKANDHKHNPVSLEAKFSNDEIEKLCRLMNHVWQYVADGLCTPSPYDRDTVFEVSVDADRLRMFANDMEEVKLADRFYNLTWDEQEAFKRRAFPFEEYE